MSEILVEAHIQCSPEALFDVIIDLRGQGRWLPGSSAFHGTREISSDPVAVGTTYHEPGPFGVRHGTVTELERPVKVTFHQPMTMKLRLRTIDVLMRYSLTAQGASTHVQRVVTLEVPWPLKLVQPLLVRSFRVENQRTLLALKAYADTLA